MASLDYKYLGSLVERAQEGDNNAFAELYAATYQKQFNFAYNYLKDEYLAQDAIQDTYVTAYKSIHTINDTALFVAWLNQINLRTCFKIRRKQARINEEMSEFAHNETTMYNGVSSDDPEKQVISIDEKEYIIKQVMNLPFSEAQAILLRYYHNMKIEEIAKLMDVSKSTVKRSLKRGQERLNELLKH